MSDPLPPESAGQLTQVLEQAEEAVLTLTQLLEQARHLAECVQSSGNGDDPVNCCFDDGNCYPMTRAECEGQGGTANRKVHIVERAQKVALTMRRLVTGAKFLAQAEQSGDSGQDLVHHGFAEGKSVPVTRGQGEAVGETPSKLPSK